ncbi:MAG TPA: 50S ribosomal protein L35 [Planctomycetota bacterium]|jgi:large subunit ribosomal protein L35|nr:50S ribosomal protein L35 [Planctomycetota bacterium]
MPKLKTKKSIKKRVKITKTGKVLRHKPGARHYKAGKAGGRRRKLRGTDLVPGKQAQTFKILVAPSL